MGKKSKSSNNFAQILCLLHQDESKSDDCILGICCFIMIILVYKSLVSGPFHQLCNKNSHFKTRAINCKGGVSTFSFPPSHMHAPG